MNVLLPLKLVGHFISLLLILNVFSVHSLAQREPHQEPSQANLVETTVDYFYIDPTTHALTGTRARTNQKSDLVVKAEIFSKITYDFNKEQTDVICTHLGIDASLYGVSLRDFLSKHHESEPVFAFRTKISAAPSLLENSTKDDVLATAEDNVRNALAALGLPPDQIDALVPSYMGPIEDQVNDRINDLVRETSIQTVAIDLGTTIMNSNKYKVYATFGKDMFYPGAETDHNGFTYEENLAVGHNVVQGAGSTSHTGLIQTGGIWKSDSMTLKVDLYLFADRSPFFSASQYVSTRLQQSDAEYNEQKDWWDLNSYAARLGAYTDRFNVYVYAGSYDGDSAAGTGGRVQLTDRFTLSADAYTGDRANLEKGYTCTLNTELGKGFNCYLRGDIFKEKYDETIDNTLDYEQLSAGLSYQKTFQNKLAAGVWSIGLEEQSGYGDRDFDQPITAGMVSLRFGF